jgi:hypothetical protein
MMRKKKINLFFIAVLFASTSVAQDLSSNAKKYFGNYMHNSKLHEILVNSFPTQEEIKLIFKDNNAYTYFGWLIDYKSQMLKKPDSSNFYQSIRVESFTTEDVLADKENYAGGMAKIKDYLKPGITFYEINYLKAEGDHSGMAYKYFVNINGKWLFFPKPWKAFETTESKKQ